jgi:cytoskeletal protein CcmA (bactofilin family)
VTGNMTCTGRLVLRATGRIKGKIRYGALEIETGGDLAGNVASLPSKERSGGGQPFFGLERFTRRPSFS